jgi:hypothetical protein
MNQVRPSGAETFLTYAKIGPAPEMKAQAARMRQFEGLTAPVLYEFEGGYLMEPGQPLSTHDDVVAAAGVLEDLWQHAAPTRTRQAQYLDYISYLRNRIEDRLSAASGGAMATFTWPLLHRIVSLSDRMPVLNKCCAVHGDATLANFVRVGTSVRMIDVSVRAAPSTAAVDRSKFMLSLLAGLHVPALSPDSGSPAQLLEKLPSSMRVGWRIRDSKLVVEPEFELHLLANIIRVATREPDKITLFKEFLKDVRPT